MAPADFDWRRLPDYRLISHNARGIADRSRVSAIDL
jgi:hypothetical protein